MRTVFPDRCATGFFFVILRALFSPTLLTAHSFFSWRFSGFAPQLLHSLSRIAGSRRYAPRFIPQAQRGCLFFGCAFTQAAARPFFRDDSGSSRTPVYPTSKRRFPQRFSTVATTPLFSPEQSAPCSHDISPLYNPTHPSCLYALWYGPILQNLL